ncbi:MAG: hypothetical protein ACI9UV_000110 [Algoriphagus sp.]|jgi:hypothetical protein
MKIILIVLISILLVSYWIIGQSDWHLNRNKHNKLPEGGLKHLNDNMYVDETGLTWELQPHIKNKFHQPDQEIEMVKNPYPNVDGLLTFDPKNPNLKFLHTVKNRGSYEAILQPNGEYLTEGLKQGTYNYSHPSGFFNSAKHLFFDVIPHFINSKYKS